MTEPIDPSVIMILSMDLRDDLEFIKNMSPTTIIQKEISILDSFMLKYGIQMEVSESNFYKAKGKLMFEMLKRLQKLADQSMNKIIEESSDKIPKKNILSVSDLPETLKDD